MGTSHRIENGGCDDVMERDPWCDCAGTRGEGAGKGERVKSRTNWEGRKIGEIGLRIAQPRLKWVNYGVVALAAFEELGIRRG